MIDRSRFRRKISLWKRNLSGFAKRYVKNRAAVLGLVIFIFYFTLALGAPIVAPYDPFDMNLDNPDIVLRPPRSSNPLGTDEYGRDVLSRLVYGSRVSLFVGFLSSGIALLIGVAVGSFAGYKGGKVDSAIMRFVDMFLTIPTFFLILLITAVFGGSVWNVMMILGLTGWPGVARLIRAQFLSVKQKDFVTAAMGAGARDPHIIIREILPNAIYPAIVDASMRISGAIMTESSLSFLGLGDPTHPSWGMMLNEAMNSFRVAWWLSLFPGIAITTASIAFNLIGDGLNDMLNPRLKER